MFIFFAPGQSELMERVVLPTLGTLSSDPDTDVRCHGAQLIVQFLSSASPKWGTELLATGSSILQRSVNVATRAREDRVRKKPWCAVRFCNIHS